MLQELGDGYGEALHEHRRRLRAAFAAHEGFEVDTQGDAFFVAFSRASDAVAAAEDAQRALAGGPIRVRMGLHTGEPRLSEEGYVGLDVHKGARIAAVGHGGQVLLSGTTRALVDADVRDLGPHRLKDLSSPEQIFQLEVDGLPSEFPLLKTLEVGMRSLPSPGTSFVGRATELEAIDGLLEDPECRLLTLVGPGGVGKTRLALEAAGRRIERYPHGVHFVPLVSVPAPELLAPAVAEAVHFPLSGFSAQEQLLDYLSERSTLLVLDNFEHLVEGSALLGELIERAPGVELLTTSRERLNVQSEWVYDVEGLGLTESINGGGALRLFVERAAQARPGFVLDENERLQALRICRLVAGMPLGIELAAAWVSMLSCAEIADEIERNVDFLATSMRDVPERHRSLRAAFDQSWRLLSDEQRDAFARLSVFRGGFDRDAAKTVAGADLRLLSELASKSLVRRPGFGRFELHELLRQYAAEKLGVESADASASTRERHARHYSGMLLERQGALMGPEMTVARDELRGELDNLRAALAWIVRENDEPTALAALEAFYTFLWMHGWFEGAETLEPLARTAGFDPDDPGSASALALAAATCRIAISARLGYDPAAEELALRCLPVLRARNLERDLGRCLCALGIVAVYRDVFTEAVSFLEEGIELARATDDTFTEVGALMDLGFAHLLMGDLDVAGDAFTAANALCDKLGNPIFRAYGIGKLGLLADAEERYRDALRLHLEGYDLFTSLGETAGSGYALSRASSSAFGLGEYAEALRLGRAGYEAFAESNHRWGLITALCSIGFAALALGDGAVAHERFGEALERARASEAVSLELLALSGIGACLAQDPGQQERAAVTLTFTTGHEQLPPSYARSARPALERLEEELTPEQVAAARDAAARANLDDLVEEALAAISVATPVGSV